METLRRTLTLADRVIIEVRLRDGWGPRAIGVSLLRSGGTISAEINRHGGARLYRAQLAADQAATDRRKSGCRSRLCHDGGLFSELCRLLRLAWSPEQIAGRRKRIERGMEQQSGLQIVKQRAKLSRFLG